MSRKVDTYIGLAVIALAIGTVVVVSVSDVPRWIVALGGGCLGWSLALVVEEASQ